MNPRLDYKAIAPEAMQHLHRLSARLGESPGISAGLRAVVELRVSQMNGCAYCCVLHTGEARAAGVPQRALDVVAAWREAGDVFSPAERAALDWAEAVTSLGPEGPGDALYRELQLYFDDAAIVDLTLVVSLMNAYNRLAVTFRAPLPPG